MKPKLSLIAGILILAISLSAFSQQSNPQVSIAPNAPKDNPVDAKASEVQALEAAIKPYIQKARASYPQAKERYLKGLPPKHTFFVTARLFDSTKRFEQVFIAVKEIKDGKISGLIWSDINLVSGYKRGDPYTFPESEIIDWTISKPDGTEEGNFVGNFLDTYQQHKIEPIVWRKQPASPERMNQRIEGAAVKYQASAPIARVVLYDIAYPHDEREYGELDGYAVILLTSLTQERREFPIKRVYVLIDGNEIDLTQIKSILSERSDASDQIAKTFGAYRADELYLLPVYLRLKPAVLLVDFAANKTAFKAAVFGSDVSADVSKLPNRTPAGASPPAAILENFIKREFPGFFNE